MRWLLTHLKAKHNVQCSLNLLKLCKLLFLKISKIIVISTGPDKSYNSLIQQTLIIIIIICMNCINSSMFPCSIFRPICGPNSWWWSHPQKEDCTCNSNLILNGPKALRDGSHEHLAQEATCTGPWFLCTYCCWKWSPIASSWFFLFIYLDYILCFMSLDAW